eukprot:7692918-Pyramimonas_sp.AAC.1
MAWPSRMACWTEVRTGITHPLPLLLVPRHPAMCRPRAGSEQWTSTASSRTSSTLEGSSRPSLATSTHKG